MGPIRPLETGDKDAQRLERGSRRSDHAVELLDLSILQRLTIYTAVTSRSPPFSNRSVARKVANTYIFHRQKRRIISGEPIFRPHVNSY